MAKLQITLGSSVCKALRQTEARQARGVAHEHW
jgi:hypothetical protein